MNIAELIKALDGLEPSSEIVVRDSVWDGVLHIAGVYEADGVVEIEVQEGETK